MFQKHIHQEINQSLLVSALLCDYLSLRNNTLQIKTETNFTTFPQSVRFTYFVCRVIHTITEDVNENERNTIEMNRKGRERFTGEILW